MYRSCPAWGFVIVILTGCTSKEPLPVYSLDVSPERIFSEDLEITPRINELPRVPALTTINQIDALSDCPKQASTWISWSPSRPEGSPW